MNFFEPNNNFLKSMQHLFVQSQWLNRVQITSPSSTIYSPLSSSTTSFSSPIKTEPSDQEEPLNLSIKEPTNRIQTVCPANTNHTIFIPHMQLFMPPMFQSIFPRQVVPITPKIEKQSFMSSLPILPSPDYKRRRTMTIKMKKSRSFKCNQCRNIFSCLSTLSEHTQQNHGGYKCHICDTSFTQRSNLQRHALRHVGFKPYTCSVCCKEYYRKDHLIRHISFNHPNVNPKDSIIQRLSSSESLNFIDNQSEVIPTVADISPPSPHNSAHSCDQSYLQSNDDEDENIFLSTAYDSMDEMTVDVIN